jgi:UDP-GlcNAc3NAcA epimerase
MRNNRKIATVVGARPQFIKASVVSRALKESEDFSEIMIHTGQHYDTQMSENIFKELEMISPKYNLSVGSGNQSYQTGEMMKRIEDVLIEEAPAAVIVYGDTNSTLAGALTAAKLNIPVAHIEAGLRSFNRRMPEEINRIVADHVSSLLFCPTEAAMSNLRAEGIHRRSYKCGDVMYDVALQYSDYAERKSRILESMNLSPNDYLVATVHRAENTDSQERLSRIMEGLSFLGKEMNVVMPLHPRTRKMIGQYGLEKEMRNLHTMEPAGFLDMMRLVMNARVVATDSGGVQKEAYFHRIPCVTLREETEWVETVNAGWNSLVELNSSESVVHAVHSAIREKVYRTDIHEYGDGRAAHKIIGVIAKYIADIKQEM